MFQREHRSPTPQSGKKLVRRTYDEEKASSDPLATRTRLITLEKVANLFACNSFDHPSNAEARNSRASLEADNATSTSNRATADGDLDSKQR